VKTVASVVATNPKKDIIREKPAVRLAFFLRFQEKISHCLNGRLE
jgi:hypothetical protein